MHVKTIIHFKAERRKKEKGSSPLQDEKEEEEPLDEETQALDAVALQRIKQILEEYEEEMNNFELKKEGMIPEIFALQHFSQLVLCVHRGRRRKEEKNPRRGRRGGRKTRSNHT